MIIDNDGIGDSAPTRGPKRHKLPKSIDLVVMGLGVDRIAGQIRNIARRFGILQPVNMHSELGHIDACMGTTIEDISGEMRI